MIQLAKFYDKEFSRLRFIFPAILGLAIAAALLVACAVAFRNWNWTSMEGQTSRAVLVMAVLGGYTWVTYDLTAKSYSGLLSPQDLNWASFRLFVNVPAGFAVSQFYTSAAIPLAFLLGAMPTHSLTSALRRTVYGLLRSEEANNDVRMPLLALPGINMNVAEAMLAEGINSIQQLASSDPVRLTIRLGQSFSYIVGLTSDALLWCYLGSEKYMSAFRLSGINGAYDCRLLLNDLYDLKKGEPDQKDAQAIVDHLAKTLEVPSAAIETILWNVAYDPTTKFIYAVWGDQLGMPDDED